jgi:hypothetical protein
VTLDGEPPQGRVVVLEFENLDKALEWRNSAAHKELIPITRQIFQNSLIHRRRSVERRRMIRTKNSARSPNL